jgi:NodT family efflux transporter outer membrane factor (OMF) lipoprotein
MISTKHIFEVSRAYLVALPLAACTVSGISPEVEDLQTPESWQRAVEGGEVRENWLSDFDDPELTVLVDEAMLKNYRLAEQAARVDEARQNVTIAGADRYPSVALSADYSVRQTVIDDERQELTDSVNGGIDIAWNVDIWGRLSDLQKEASLSFSASEAQFEDARLQLAADVASAWYQVIAAQQLFDLFDQRRDSLEQSFDIVNRGYQQGINNAVDVYLARTSVEQERARVAQQRQNLDEAVARLQLLLARYPDGDWFVGKALPSIDTPIPAGLPSQLLTRRPDIRQSWFNLLSNDAGLAAAHKARFPSLRLVGGPSRTSQELSDFLDGNAIAWSLVASLTQPLYQGGRLKAGEERARQRVIQAEKQYLDLVFRAFAEVENAISRDTSLHGRYEAFLGAEQDSAAAYELSFEQYQRGLVSYATVLESQRRAFDSQSTVIDLRNQLLQNRITLYTALGGEFGTVDELALQ